jgi:hypothetical protein
MKTEYKELIKKKASQENCRIVIENIENIEINKQEIKIYIDDQKAFYRILTRLRDSGTNENLYTLAEEIEEDYPCIAEEIRYWILAEEILEREISLIGDKALEKAEEAEGVLLESINILGFNGEPKNAVENLLTKYKEVQGEVAPFLIGKHMNEVSTEKIDPPKELENYI